MLIGALVGRGTGRRRAQQRDLAGRIRVPTPTGCMIRCATGRGEIVSTGSAATAVRRGGPVGSRLVAAWECES
jgi:hypothetical protein